MVSMIRGEWVHGEWSKEHGPVVSIAKIVASMVRLTVLWLA